MDVIKTDVLVIGSGAAGLAASVYAAKSDKDVLVIDKGAIGKSGSTVGAVQIASLGKWSCPEDNEQIYQADINESGRGLSDPELTQVLADDITERLQDLIDWGLKLDVNEEKEIAVTGTSGHSVARSISARKGKTGLGILQTLIRKVKSFQNVATWSDVITLELVKSSGRVAGAIVYDLRSNMPYLIQSKAVIIATGGIGQLYPVTSNPVQATGDGFSIGLGAGATLIDMEQVQFYPVSIVAPRSIAGLCISFYHLSKLFNSQEKRFMKDYEPKTLEDTTRDKLAIAISTEVAAGRGTVNGGVWIDAAEEIRQVKQEFPHEHELCLDRGVDLANGRAEVGPAAHFIMGGIKIDSSGSSDVPGLFVAGETAGGLHGGNRLGNNALSECIVFGARAGLTAAKAVEELSKTPFIDPKDIKKIKEGYWSHLFTPTENQGVRPHEVKRKIQELLGHHVGVIRSNKGLQHAQEQLREIESQLINIKITKREALSREILDFIEAQHMLRTARAIVGAALIRTESRGAHYNKNHPNLTPNIYHTTAQLVDGQLKYIKNPKKGV
jgi:fumarate reductase (CoM/CoB) subunit A